MNLKYYDDKDFAKVITEIDGKIDYSKLKNLLDGLKGKGIFEKYFILGTMENEITYVLLWDKSGKKIELEITKSDRLHKIKKYLIEIL